MMLMFLNSSLLISCLLFLSMSFCLYLYLLCLLMLTCSILFVVFLGENYVLGVVSNLMLLFCVLFFMTKSLLFLFICLEVVTFLILLVLLFYGYQIEKVASSWYLLVLGVLTSMLLLFFVFCMQSFSFLLSNNLLSLQFFIFLFLSFFMKLPLFLLHMWLPKVHVESPTLGSVLLASLLLKLGCWGALLFVLFMMPSVGFVKLILILSIFICGFYCIFQSDGKALVGYSSVFHMAGFMIFLMTFMGEGEFGAVLMMISHGLVSAILFLYVGMMYSEFLSREVFTHHGGMKTMLVLGVLLFIYFLMNSGLPPMMGFVSEIYGMVSVYMANLTMVLVLSVYFMIGFYYSLGYGLSIFLGSSSFNVYMSIILIFFMLLMFFGLLFVF